MGSNNKKNITDYIGDYYESSARKDRIAMNRALDYIENLIGHGEFEPDCNRDVLDYFNEVFSGRKAYNALSDVSDYPAESIIRELLQNAFDCCYDSKDIKLSVNFKSGNIISIAYNETGFTFENFLCYLGFGLSYGQEGAEYREGRFGVGAKSVFKNVEFLTMRSNSICFRIANKKGSLVIEELDLRRSVFSGTEIVIKVSEEQYELIKDNLSALTVKKGRYINIPELCFAFNRKKVLNYRKNSIEANGRTFNIAVLDSGKLITVYKIIKHNNTVANTLVTRFMCNNKNIVDFICAEVAGFTYLLPFAVSSVAKNDVLNIFSAKYNYFSTYELTGLMKNKNEIISDEKLSSFFVSVPAKYVTNFRTGIRHDSESEVRAGIESGLLNIISYYRKYFVLLIAPLPDNSGYCYMRPDSYAFEFVKKYIMTTNLGGGLKNKFQTNITVQFKDGENPVPYTELVKTAYQSKILGVSETEHLNGDAYAEYIEKELQTMRSLASGLEDKTFYAAYSWNEGEKSGTVFRYEFYRGGKVYVVDSLKTPMVGDFNLHQHFSSMTGYIIGKYLGEDNALKDEKGFISIIGLLDDRYDEAYKLTAKSPELCVSYGDNGFAEEFKVSLESMKIGNIVSVMNALAAHRHRFESTAAYNEAEKMFMSVFCTMGTVTELIKNIRLHGGKVSIGLDSYSQYCLTAYGKHFQITSDMTVKDLTEMTGDFSSLSKYGLLIGRKLGFGYDKGRYLFDKERVTDILNLSEEKSAFFDKIFIADVNVGETAVLDRQDRIIEIGFPADLSEAAEKIIILNNSLDKNGFAGLIERILCGENRNMLSKNLSRAEQVNLVLNAANGGIYGYGSTCTVCGYDSHTINCFSAKVLKTNVIHLGTEKCFTFTLYVCANCSVISRAWIIDDLRIGGLSPYEWLDEVQKRPYIPSELLSVDLIYREQLAYADDSALKSNGDLFDNMTVSEPKTVSFELTSLMAAKWRAENS